MNDFRKHIDLVKLADQKKQLDEYGGWFDKMLSILPGDLGSGAAGRVDIEAMNKALRSEWIKTVQARGVNKKDSQALKAFFRDTLGIPDDVIAGFEGLKKPKADLKLAFRDAAKDLYDQGQGRGFGADAKGKGKAGGKKTGGKRVSQGSIDPKVLSFMKKLGGDPTAVIKLAKQAEQKDPAGLRKRPLALMGYLILKDAGEI